MSTPSTNHFCRYVAPDSQRDALAMADRQDVRRETLIGGVLSFDGSKPAASFQSDLVEQYSQLPTSLPRLFWNLSGGIPKGREGAYEVGAFIGLDSCQDLFDLVATPIGHPIDEALTPGAEA